MSDDEHLYPEALKQMQRVSREDLLAQMKANPSWVEQLRSLRRAATATGIDAAVGGLGRLLKIEALSTIQQGYRALQTELDKVRSEKFWMRIIEVLDMLSDDVNQLEQRVADLNDLAHDDRGNLLISQAERDAALATHPDSIDALAEAVARIALRGAPDESLFEDDIYFVWLIAQLTPQEIRVFRRLPYNGPSGLKLQGKAPQEPDGQRVALHVLAYHLAKDFSAAGINRDRIEAALVTLHQRLLIEAKYASTGPLIIHLTREGNRLRGYLEMR